MSGDIYPGRYYDPYGAGPDIYLDRYSAGYGANPWAASTGTLTLTANSGSLSVPSTISWAGSAVSLTFGAPSSTYGSTYGAVYTGPTSGFLTASAAASWVGATSARAIVGASGAFATTVSGTWPGGSAVLRLVGAAGGFVATGPVIQLPMPVLVPPVGIPDLVVHLRDWTGTRVAQIDDVIKLEFVIRHQDVGSWVLDLHPDAAAAAVLRDTLNAGVIRHAGIEVVRGGQLILSGPVTSIEGSRKGMTERITLSGADDTIWLDRREAKPQPLTAAPPYSTNAYDVRTGVASTVLRSYVDANLGPSALAGRHVPGLVLGVDPLVGDTITGQARYQTVLELLQGLAVAGGDLGFRIISTGAGGLEFDVYQPVDRTATVKFSQALGNLGDYDYKVAAPTGNYGFGAGGGEGTARTIVEEGDSSSVATWGLIEFFRDRRDTTDTTQITQSLDEELAKQASTRAVTITPIDTPQVAFGVHYGLGDRVTAVVDDLTIVEVVREVKITYSSAGQLVQPTLASAGSGPPAVPSFFRGTSRTQARVTDLERR